MNPNYSETYSLSAVGEHCPGSLRRGLVKTSSSLLLMQSLLLLLHFPIQNAFYLPNTMKGIAAFVGLLYRWNISVVAKWFLLWAFYRLWYCLLRGESGSFTPDFSLWFPLWRANKNTSSRIWASSSKALRFWWMVLDHLKRPVNKAEPFRYMPSEPEPLWWSTDSQKYHCWHYCGASWETRAEAFLLYYFQLSLECAAVNTLFTNTFTSSSSLVPVWCWFTFVLKKDTVICAEMIGLSTVFSVLCCLRGQKTSYDDY